MTKWLNAKGRQKIVFLTVFSLLATSVDIASRDADPKIDLNSKRRRSLSQTKPIVEYTAHNRGNIQLAIANNGTFGTLGGSIPDPFTGEAIPSCIYPKNSDIVFLWVAALWIGAVVGRDTLVSCANEDWYRTTEFWPDIKPFGDFQYKSMDESSAFFAEDAFSEEDIICSYTDTVTDPSLVESDPTDARPHKPLGIKISQRSMSWSYSYADDFILFDYQIENIGHEILKDVYMGIYLDGDVWHVTRNGPEGWNDDMVGFYRTHPVEGDCGFIDTVNVAWHADNDGDPVNHSQWDEKSARGVVGIKVIRTPSDSLRYSYNWWIINYGDATRDFGPRRKGTPDDPYRDFGPRMGTPTGDRNKYYVLRHEEFDYDLLTTAVDHSDEGWLPPPEDAADFARGYDTRHLLSFGPFDVNPGEKLPISFALIGGENFHQDAADFNTYHDPYNPNRYYDKLDFSALARNLTWASWVYDNPGVDTDGDDYYGKYRVCCYDTSVVEIDTTIGGVDTTISQVVYGLCDTTFYEGDGVPDFRGASPPPAPVFWVLPRVGSFRIRFNGQRSETTRDQFSDLADFEGYRVYLARDERPNSFSMIASFDKD
ncbi:MAG: hypothetical protein KAU36_07325, partial [candidate division Zixibacteria bacterium]|nr:hypothetical protein [candidate division Zixibacteria bacterium]